MLFPTGTSGRERYWPLMTILLIVANAFIYMLEELYLQANGPEAFLQLLSNITFNVCTVGATSVPHLAATGLASMFLHGSILHVAGNMWFLWIFGRKVEKYFGRGWFLAFYVLAGYAAIIGHGILGGVVCATSTDGLLVGASGAVAGVMGAFLFLYPGTRLNVAIIPAFNFKVPALFFLAFWFLADLLRGVGWFAADGDAVAHWAHVVGFLAGFAVVFVTTMLIKPAPKPDPFAYLDE